jgi:myo-inositol-1(or 4)-monophosphatase
MSFATLTHSSKSMLETAIEAAKLAGRVVTERFPAERTLISKGYRDIVTDTDTAAEAAILELVRTRFPDHAILAEEAGDNGVDSARTWVIDPLDGTTNYAHHVPVFAVSIGVLEGREPLIGVVHDPLRGHVFAAVRNQGAWLDDGPIHVSTTERLSDAVVGLDWGRHDSVRRQTVRLLSHIAPRCRTLRGLGSAALALAYVAAGWMDAYFHLAIRPWDVAAGKLLVLEAGGRCTTLQGDPHRVDSPSCLATNGPIHSHMLSVMQAKLAEAAPEVVAPIPSRYPVDTEVSLTSGHA